MVESEAEYVPSRGDYVWIGFNPQSGHEQSGRRPALVLSHATYNRASGLAVVCPVTRQQKGYSFEVAVGGDAPVDGVILCDHVRSVDWRSRKAELIGTDSAEIVDRVVMMVRRVIE